MQRSIKGEVAWVTGGGTGIGQAGAVRLAAEGAKIVLTGRRLEPLEDTAKMIRAKGGEAIVAPADMGKRDEVQAVAK
ncbi:MAG: SDR family NAD(P)-dependent oxidoreductase, partial [Methylobacteriaceae bacterium]|nr:SDR family NAD(P)-dependent oxidoreductase [Methylobacteriaceae bacterium]